MSIHRGIDGSEPLRPEPVASVDVGGEYRKATRSFVVAIGTLACPECDAPVAPSDPPVRPADTIACPYCLRSGFVRDFLSLSAPSRPARVAVRVTAPRAAWAARPKR